MGATSSSRRLAHPASAAKMAATTWYSNAKGERGGEERACLHIANEEAALSLHNIFKTCELCCTEGREGHQSKDRRGKARGGGG